MFEIVSLIGRGSVVGGYMIRLAFFSLYYWVGQKIY